MSTFMANKANIERKWYILDAAGKPLGKTAVRAADLPALRMPERRPASVSYGYAANITGVLDRPRCALSQFLL